MRYNGNILHLKQVCTGWNKWLEKDIGNNIAYDVRSRQDKIAIVNFTEVKLKGLKVSTAHRIDVGIDCKYVTQP